MVRARPTVHRAQPGGGKCGVGKDFTLMTFVLSFGFIDCMKCPGLTSSIHSGITPRATQTAPPTIKRIWLSRKLVPLNVKR